METRPVCTRVAPSPTGDPHIGTVFMALFNYAFARSHGGRFILRIEDTDQQRSTAASERAIFESLHWAGIPWDEGPDKGGPHGPYRQSERTEIYRRHVELLLAGGRAYRCFCSAERLDTLRREQLAAKADLGYDGHCRGLDPTEAARRAAAGEPCVLRLASPAEGDCVVPERLRGEIRIPWSTVDDQVLLKSDGFPTYHLANVVDDHLMGVSHVIRGEEWISSLPKHLLLYEAFGWEPPEFIHLPLLRNPDKSKLSKRRNPTSVFYYRDAGLLPEAVLNYLGQMGYTRPGGEELFTLDEFVSDFEISRVSLGGPVFDQAKLLWLNGRWLRERMGPEELLVRLKGWRLHDETWLKILPLAQKRLSSLAELLPTAAYLFAASVEVPVDELVSKALDGPATARLLRILLWEMEKLREFDAVRLRECVERVALHEDLKLRDALAPLFVAVSGRKVALPLFESCEILGLDLTRRRFAAALESLEAAGHAPRGKALKALETDYKARYA
jgi:glutamyl-tRNA synthetase